MNPMRGSEQRNVIVLLAASSAIFFQTGDLRAKAENHPSVPDVRQIVQASIAATQRDWQRRLHYTYIERDESRRRDVAGRVESEDVDVSRTIVVDDAQFEQIIERKGQPLSVEEERKQREKLDKQKRETPQQRSERLRKQVEENATFVQEVPKAFDFQIVGEEVVNGRPAFIVQATPHPGYRAQGRYGKMFSKVAGKLWVDKQDFGWIKVDAQVIQPLSMGIILLRLQPGSQIEMEQTRVDGGVWMPERVEVRAAARILLVKNLIDRVVTFSEYRLADIALPARRQTN